MLMAIAGRWNLRFVWCGYLFRNGKGMKVLQFVNVEERGSFMSFLFPSNFFLLIFFLLMNFFFLMERENCFGTREWVRLGILF